MICDHEWEFTDRVPDFDGDTLTFNVKCMNCRKTGKEFWIYGRTEEDYELT